MSGILLITFIIFASAKEKSPLIMALATTFRHFSFLVYEFSSKYYGETKLNYTQNNKESKIHCQDGEYFTIQWHALCLN